MEKTDDLMGKSFSIIGVVEEDLKLNDNRWVKLRLENNGVIVINIKHCKEVKEVKEVKEGK
jgi:hypothetical protein